MAATDERSPALQALTGFALALLGASATQARAQESDGASVQRSHYEESPRELFGAGAAFDPITVESTQARASYSPDDRWRLSLNYEEDTWSGATPVGTAPVAAHANPDGISGASPFPTVVYFDQTTLLPLELNSQFEPTGRLDSRLVHTMSGASPETRRQVNLTLSREYADSAWRVGAGVSHEHDYDSTFVSFGSRWDLNHNATTLNAGVSYTSSDSESLIASGGVRFIYDACPFLCDPVASTIEVTENDDRIIRGAREDWTATTGVTQILNRDSVLAASVGFTLAQGYLANSYKIVELYFIDPELQIFALPGSYYSDPSSLLERRPVERNQFTLDLRYVLHVAAANGALHLGYRFFQDDWGIGAHTFDIDWAQPLGHGWMLTPRMRYYTQSAADFYVPYMITFQSTQPLLIDPERGQVYGDGADFNSPVNYFDDLDVANPLGVNPLTGAPVVDANGVPVSQDIADRLFTRRTSLDRRQLPANYSSDARLSAFGALSVGIILGKQLTQRTRIELSYEHYVHAGNLRLGGGGERRFADLDYDLVSAQVRFALDPGAGAAELDRR